MRTLTLLALGILLAMGAALPVNARPRPLTLAVFFNVSLSAMKEQPFTDGFVVQIYNVHR